ncbi:DUF11 domain-containing protein [Fibrisoma montanum]|uniref:DUF11 domain-containing protein n=2 Tax=Fibrisoma montanum TaxID=2305895 RepID=A0A418LYD5_9BACT|nr:DUF11 domain-containing protein [Fibrisoma montanum]
MPSLLRWLILFVSLPVVCLAQVTITHPMPRLVVQRGTDNTGRLYIAGRLTSAADRIEAQLTPVAAGQGTATGWQTIQTNPSGNLFLGYLTGSGGWYVVTVRAIRNNVSIGQATVQPVGIGEVFITAGQSNSRGLGVADNDLGTATDRVNAIDSINHYYPPNGQSLFSSGDPMPVPAYKALTAARRVFPMAESSWGWGELGDYIVNRYNVPVAFYTAGWDASTIENWINSANGIPTCNRYYCVENWPNLQPYTNLKNVLRYYASMAGVRSVLWHQGEAEYGDAGSGSIPDYRNRLQSLIQKSRQDFGGRNVPWVVARVSFDGTVTRPDLITEQQNVINTPNLNVFQGPYNDTIVNRNAGQSDVHFRNSFRPTPHPRYYLNPGAIPAAMGLSRFARNWNNSLDNSFFQNAQPVLPEQFAVTGNIADYVPPGSPLQVSFATLGTFAADNQWQVQLLDSAGNYRATLGTGPASPVAVQLPGNLTSGRFQLRVVATSPWLPAVPSNLFRLGNPPAPSGPADLNLTLSVSNRTPGTGDQTTFTLRLQNAGPKRAVNVTVRDRLPANLAVLSTSGLTFADGVLTGTVASLDSGSAVSFNFVARPTAAGTYRNAAEIAQTSNSDPDSQPDTGTADGQDDAAELSFRTRETSSAVFTSPNPNQAPLPAVVSNQPAPDPSKADVQLAISASRQAIALNDTLTYTLTLTNLGGQTATLLNVAAYLPAGLVFESSSDMAPGVGTVSGGISSLAPKTSYSLRFRARATQPGRLMCPAQLTVAGIPDPDSAPGNGTTNGEDDTARVEIRVR